MAAPSKPWVTISDTQVDADSPIDTTLVTGLRDDAIHVRETIYDPAVHTPAKAHEHNGTDSAQIKDGNIIKSGAVVIFDDFLFGLAQGWGNVNSGATAQDVVNGVIRITENSANPNQPHGFWTGYKSFQLSSGATIACELKVKKVNDFKNCVLGLGDAAATVPSNGMYFNRNGTAGNWQSMTRNGVSATTTTLDVAPSTSYQTLKLVATTSDVKFYVDNVLKATHATYIPAVIIAPLFFLYDPAGADRSADIDYVHIYTNIRP